MSELETIHKPSTANLSQTKQLLSDFKEITKFRLAVSVVFSTIAGYLLACQSISYVTLLLLSIGGYCMVGASNVYNQIIERDLDAKMDRTHKRPLPSKRTSPKIAFILATVLTLLGLGILYSINEKTAFFGAISIFLYVSIYTPLKTKTPFAVFIGAIPGAIPFMLGWVAATGKFGVEAGMLFMIQFFWQFPHFWAIGWFLYDDYKKAGFFMLPTSNKDRKTTFHIITYTICTIISSVLPFFINTGKLKLSAYSAVLMLFLGFFMLKKAFVLYKTHQAKDARKLMLASVLYITILQLVYVLDKWITVWI